ncbi:hypothetical protein [Methylosinus sp. LW4]|uniref:hypothetical protein n=1 Tax=Methylosinus sp. LW4 TaxID=136993 RepID=UPI0012F828DB|nr:hypothetical protein [Methylosinus sp. LW4]
MNEITTTESSVIEFISKNGGLITAAVTVMSAILAMSFLFSFLSIFDWNLIWFVEYQDIVKFSLIAFALMSGSIYTFFQILNHIYNYTEEKFSQKRWLPLAIYGGIFFIKFLIDMWNDFYGPNVAETEYHIFGLVSAVFIIIICYRITDISELIKKNSLNIKRVLSEFVILIMVAGTFGWTYGLKIRGEQTSGHKLLIKQGDDRIVYDHATLILVTSHHSIFKVDDDIITVQSGDIIQFTSRRVR